MTQEKPERFIGAWVVYLTIALVLFFGIVFGVAFIAASQQRNEEAPTEITAETYLQEVTALLEDANPENGAVLVTRDYECYACHVQGADTIAPSYTGLAERAVLERPPLAPTAYIYESIVFPSAHIVEGYPDAMPKNYGSRLSQQELGDIIAYLLTQ